MVKNPPASAGDIRDAGSIPGLGRSPEGGHGNPLQHSCLENPHGEKSLDCCSPLGHKELDTTEQVSTGIYSLRFWFADVGTMASKPTQSNVLLA